MKEFSITALAKIIKAKPPKNTNNCLTGVSVDSRTTEAGDCFFAICGERFDGHDYVADAFAGGVVCAVVGKEIKGTKFIGKPILKVNDTVRALGDFAREYRRQMNFKVVAITGSVGKTTTREIAYHVLSRHFRVFAAPKNFNNNIGLPLALLGADREDRIVIVELGSNYPGEIAYLTRIAQPDIAIVTNVYPSHLAGFGNLQTIIQEKLSISEGLQGDGILIINADFDRLVSACRAKGAGFTTFGKSDGCDIQAQDITYNGFSSQLTIDDTQVYLPLPGPGSVENALAAWAICRQFGQTVKQFAHDVKNLNAITMRTETLKIGTITVINDCYNANPASMKNALDIMEKLDLTQKRRLVFICADMAELGQHSRKLHQELGNSIAHANVKLLLAIGKFAKIAAQNAKKIAKKEMMTVSFENTRAACNNLAKFVKDYDIVLVKGSRTAKLERAVEKLKELFA